MKNYLILNRDIIIEILFYAFIFDFILFMASYFYNKRAYKEIVKIYEEKIGELPLDTILCKDASVFATPFLYNSKVRFITRSLNFKYHRFLHNGISIEGYNLIRNMPNRLTLGFRIESLSLLISIPIMIGMFIIV